RAAAPPRPAPVPAPGPPPGPSPPGPPASSAAPPVASLPSPCPRPRGSSAPTARVQSSAPVRRLRLPLLLVAVLAVRTALAYVPAPGAIFRHLLTGRDEQRISTARVEGTLVLAGGASSEAGSQGEIQSDARVLLKLPGRCRLEA